MEFQAELTVFHLGTIRNLFSRGAVAPQRKLHDPLGLPEVPKQCIHVEEHYDSQTDERFGVRCLSNVPDFAVGRHGWLCGIHTDLQSQEWSRAHTSDRAFRDRDTEIVESIIKTDARIIKSSGRVSFLRKFHVEVKS